MNWSLLIAAVVGAVAAIIGGTLAAIVTARREHRRWQRDKLAEGTEKLSAVLLDVLLKFRTSGYQPPKQEIENLDLQRITSAVGTIAIYGSQQLGSAAFDLLDAYEALTLTPPGNHEKRDQLMDEFNKRGRIVSMLTRRDLSLRHPISSSLRPGVTAPEPSLSREALDQQMAQGKRVRRRVRRMRLVSRTVFAVYTLILLVIRARRRRRGSS